MKIKIVPNSFIVTKKIQNNYVAKVSYYFECTKKRMLKNVVLGKIRDFLGKF